MEDRKVQIISTVNAQVVLDAPELRLTRTWMQKGAKQSIKYSELEEAIYNPGVEALFQEGTLYIEDMDVKIALGLEPEDAKAPENIVVLTQAQQKRFLTVAPIHELKDILKKISIEQARELAHYAIDIEITDITRADLLKEVTGINVLKAITLKREN